MKANNYFQTKRGDAGINARLQAAADAVPDGDPISFEGVIDFALEKYDRRIKAMLRKAKINLPDDGPLTVEGMKDVVRSQSGLDIETLSADGIMQAVDKRLALQMSDKLGFSVDTVLNAAAMKEQIKAAVIVKLQDGSGAGILKGKTLQTLRSVATFARAGKLAERKKILNRMYQERYRRGHRQEWYR